MSAWNRAAVLGFVGMLAACASTPLPPAVAKGELANAADGTRIVLLRGGELMVQLDASITTGFQWQMTANVAPVLTPIGQPIYVGNAADPRNLGAGGVNVFRFRAGQPGSTALEFAYRRAWETGVAPAKVLRYEVFVQ
jgi:inhibitor of cysteine peptidase